MSAKYSFTEFVIARRKSLNIKQRHLALALGFTPQFLNNIERGVSRIPCDYLKDLSVALKTPYRTIEKMWMKDDRLASEIRTKKRGRKRKFLPCLLTELQKKNKSSSLK